MVVDAIDDVYRHIDVLELFPHVIQSEWYLWSVVYRHISRAVKMRIIQWHFGQSDLSANSW